MKSIRLSADFLSHLWGNPLQPLSNSKSHPVFGYNYAVIHKKSLTFFLLALLCAGCNVTSATPAPSLPEFVTATLPVTAVLTATQTPLPPSPAPTISPIAGTTTSELNVRADTSTASESLGAIPAFSPVQIIGKDVSGFWLRIIFNDGAGWVRADFVQVTDASAEIPVWNDETGVGSAGRGVVLRGVNVRNGPGRDFETLGLLNQNDVVSILEKDASGAWMKIVYPIAPEGTGWVAAEFLQIENAEAIPTLAATIVTTATQAVETPVTSGSAQTTVLDGDSADTPLVNFMLSPASTRSAQFQGEVSTLAGDSEDWIAFSAQSDDVVIQVSCETGSIKVELFPAGGTSSMFEMICGHTRMIRITADQAYVLKISTAADEEAVPTKYKIKIKIIEQ